MAIITIARGEDREETFTITLNGTPLDLTTVGVGVYVSRYVNGPRLFEKHNTADGGDDTQIELLDQVATPGKFKAKFASADTIGLAKADYSIDVWTDADGERTQAIAPFTFRVTGRASPMP
jgi:hypothetical protein